MLRRGKSIFFSPGQCYNRTRQRPLIPAVLPYQEQKRLNMRNTLTGYDVGALLYFYPDG